MLFGSCRFYKKRINLVRNFVWGTLCNVGAISETVMRFNFTWGKCSLAKNKKIFTHECSFLDYEKKVQD